MKQILKTVFICLISSFSLASTTLDFLKAHKNFDSYQINNYDEKYLRRVVQDLKEDLSFEEYESIYMEFQEACFFVDDEDRPKCDHLENFYLDLNDIYNEDTEPVVGGKIEDIAGITLDGHEIRRLNAIEIDPNYEYTDRAMGEHVVDLPMNSPQLKGGIRESLQGINIDTIICEFEKPASIDINANYLQNLAKQLEDVLISDQVTLEDQQKSFCTLVAFYEESGNLDRLIDFVYLNMPEGENFCK